MNSVSVPARKLVFLATALLAIGGRSSIIAKGTVQESIKEYLYKRQNDHLEFSPAEVAKLQAKAADQHRPEAELFAEQYRARLRGIIRWTVGKSLLGWVLLGTTTVWIAITWYYMKDLFWLPATIAMQAELDELKKAPETHAIGLTLQNARIQRLTKEIAESPQLAPWLAKISTVFFPMNKWLTFLANRTFPQNGTETHPGMLLLTMIVPVVVVGISLIVILWNHETIAKCLYYFLLPSAYTDEAVEVEAQYASKRHNLPQAVRSIVEGKLLGVRLDIKEGTPTEHTLNNIEFITMMLQLPHDHTNPRISYAKEEAKQAFALFNPTLQAKLNELYFSMYRIGSEKVPAGGHQGRGRVVKHIYSLEGKPGTGKSWLADRLCSLLGVHPLRIHISSDPDSMHGTKEQPGQYALELLRHANAYGYVDGLVLILDDNDRETQDAKISADLLEFFDPDVCTVRDNYFGIDLPMPKIIIVTGNIGFSKHPALANRIGDPIVFTDALSPEGKRVFIQQLIAEHIQTNKGSRFGLNKDDITEEDINKIFSEVQENKEASMRDIQRAVRDFVRRKEQAKYAR